jgi:hypothetical protein
VSSVSTFTETDHNFWKCQTTYHGCPITIQLHAERGFIKLVIVENLITPTGIQRAINERISSLQWKFDYFKVRTRFKPEQFRPNWFSFYRDRDSGELMLSIRLSDPADTGQWFLRFRGRKAFDLEWIPR